MAGPDDDGIEIEIKSLEPAKTIERHTGLVRERIALSIVAIIGLTFITPIVATVVSPSNAAAIKELAQPIHELIALLSVIIGFYFGTTTRPKR